MPFLTHFLGLKTPKGTSLQERAGAVRAQTRAAGSTACFLVSTNAQGLFMGERGGEAV